jgi:two-component system sensor histidine kinase YesM
VNNEGLILSSTEKNELGEYYPPSLFSRFDKDSGYFRSPDGAVILYARVRDDWYLADQIPRNHYSRARSGLYIIVFLAAILGVAFASSCLIMQQRYIFKPLRNMLAEMSQFREAGLRTELSYHSMDEIGQINREVEQLFCRLNDLIKEVYVNKIYSQEATLKMLTSQINPHFLYNTLDSIHWKAIQNKDFEVSEQIEALSDMFRHVLSPGKDLVTVAEETAQLENYLFIMNFRYGKRLNCTISVNDDLKNIKIPKLILQPLVENSILHGIDKCVENGRIKVTVDRNNDLLSVKVWDNGMGADMASINSLLQDKEISHNVFALKNIDRRVKLRYGDAYGVVFESGKGEGTTVAVLIPFVSEEQEYERSYTG